jgi:hypothetical protein
VNPSSTAVLDGKIFEIVASSNAQDDTKRDAYVANVQARCA